MGLSRREAGEMFYNEHPNGEIPDMEDLLTFDELSDDEREHYMRYAERVMARLALLREEEELEETKLKLSLVGKANDAYAERNKVVAAFAHMASSLGYSAGIGQHDPSDKNWDPQWRNIVFVELPQGQVSWHLHDSELPLFEQLRPYLSPWDGHSTSEKYFRLDGFAKSLTQQSHLGAHGRRVAFSFWIIQEPGADRPYLCSTEPTSYLRKPGAKIYRFTVALPELVRTDDDRLWSSFHQVT